MDEARLDELIRKLHEAPLDLPEAKDCPPFAELWAHVSAARSPGEAAGHVDECPRCRRVLEIMRQELAPGEGPERRTRRVPAVYRLGIPLAVAACIGLAFILARPRGQGARSEMEEMIAPFCHAFYDRQGASELRGPSREGAAETSAQRAVLEKLLSDPGLRAARSQHLEVRATLRRDWRLGLITSNEQGYLTLTAAGLAADTREKLQELIQQENETRDTFVDAVRTHVPGVEAEDIEVVRRALSTWLEEAVLGTK